MHEISEALFSEVVAELRATRAELADFRAEKEQHDALVLAELVSHRDQLNSLAAFANTLDGTLANVRRVIGESLPKAIKLLGAIRNAD